MKKIVLILLAAFPFVSVFAQSTNMELLNIPSQSISIHPDSFEVKIYFELKNLTNDSLNVVVAKINTQYTAGQNAYLCWDFCYGSVPQVTDGNVRIGAGDSTGHGQYVAFNPQGVAGVASVTLRFINEALPSDFVEQTYSFNSTTTSIDREQVAAWWSGPVFGQNNSEVRVSFDPARPFAANESIRILSIQGQELWNQPINGQSTVQLPASSLPTGVYLVAWMRNGQIADIRKWAAVYP